MDIRRPQSKPRPAGDFPGSSLVKRETTLETLPAPNTPNQPPRTHSRPLRKLRRFVLGLILVSFFLGGGYLFWQTHTFSKKINLENSSERTFIQDSQALVNTLNPLEKTAPLKGQTEGRINILLLGAAGQGKPGQNLTDTLMLMSIDTKNMRLGLLSLPRDLYVNAPDFGYLGKINALFQFGLSNNLGIEPLKQTVEKITGQPLHYYLVMDFDGFIQIIDDLGGINVEVARDIYDPRYPGPNYSYETFELKKGWQKLDGATALKYVRERHADPEGDFGRAKRQQQVLQTVKNKAFSLGTFLNVPRLSAILQTLGDNLKTNITLDELAGFVELTKTVDTQNISNIVIDAWQKDSLLKVSHVQVGPVRAFVLVPRVGNYSEVQELASELFDLNRIKERQAKMLTEQARIILVNQSSDSTLTRKINQLLAEKIGLENISVQATNNSNVVTQTQVFDLSGGAKLFTLDELLKKLPATLANTPAPLATEGDLLIFLGNDLVEAYTYEEASLADFKEVEALQLDNLNLLEK